MRKIEPNLKKGDVLIVAGNFGFGFWYGMYWPQEMFFDHIDKELWRNQIAIFNAIREIKAGRGNSSVGILCGLGGGCILEYMNPYVND